MRLYLIRQEFFCDWYDAVHKGDIDAWNMAYKAQEMLAMQREEGIDVYKRQIQTVRLSSARTLALNMC